MSKRILWENPLQWHEKSTYLHLTRLSTVMLQTRGQRWQTNRKSSWHPRCLSCLFLHRTRSWPWVGQGWWNGCCAERPESSGSPWEHSPCLLAGGSGRRLEDTDANFTIPGEIFGNNKTTTTKKNTMLNHSSSMSPVLPCNYWSNTSLSRRQFQIVVLGQGGSLWNCCHWKKASGWRSEASFVLTSWSQVL